MERDKHEFYPCTFFRLECCVSLDLRKQFFSCDSSIAEKQSWREKKREDRRRMHGDRAERVGEWGDTRLVSLGSCETTLTRSLKAKAPAKIWNTPST